MERGKLPPMRADDTGLSGSMDSLTHMLRESIWDPSCLINCCEKEALEKTDDFRKCS